MTDAAVIVELTPPAQRDMKALWKVSKEITDELRVLKTNPQKGHSLSGSLQGVRALEFALQGSGLFRAAYLYFEKENKVTIFLVGPHENFYIEADRRAKLMKGLVDSVREEAREKSNKKSSTSKPKKT